MLFQCKSEDKVISEFSLQLNLYESEPPYFEKIFEDFYILKLDERGRSEYDLDIPVALDLEEEVQVSSFTEN